MSGEPVIAVVTRVLPATPEAVFDEWLDPEALRDWMCPRPAIAVGVELDPVVGGAVRLEIEQEGARVVVTGRFLEIDRPRRLAFTWKGSDWLDPSAESVVTVVLEPHADGTLMRILHELLPPDTVERHERGWALVARQLEDILKSRRRSSPS
jgi:uncharacterized protein YndB with AHSA1/START domain